MVIAAVCQPLATSSPRGKTAAAHYKAIEVLRRQADGTWKLIVGGPGARM
jgi:ketosteroid isomerase-like protein